MRIIGDPICPSPDAPLWGTWTRPTSPYDRVATIIATPSQMRLRGALVGRLTEGPPDPPQRLSRRARARRRDAGEVSKIDR